MRSNSSSSVPTPPGSTMNASARSSMTLLTLAHRVGDDQLVGLAVGQFAMHQHLGDHPDGPAAACARRAGHRAHRRNMATAPHQRPAPLGDRLTEFGSELQQLRMRGRGGAVHGTPPTGPRSLAAHTPKRRPTRGRHSRRRPAGARTINSGGADSLERPSARGRARTAGRSPRRLHGGAVVLGPDGVGKSTLARLAAEQFCRPAPEHTHPLGHRHPRRARGALRRFRPPGRHRRHRQAGGAIAGRQGVADARRAAGRSVAHRRRSPRPGPAVGHAGLPVGADWRRPDDRHRPR